MYELIAVSGLDYIILCCKLYYETQLLLLFNSQDNIINIYIPQIHLLSQDLSRKQGWVCIISYYVYIMHFFMSMINHQNT